MNLGDLSQPGLEVLLGFVLNTTILDEGGVVVSTILTGDPTELIDIAGEVERASRLELVPESLFNFRLEVLEPHPVNGILQPGILTTLEASENTALEAIMIGNVLCTVPVVSLDQHDFLRYVFSLLHCAETEDIGGSGVRLLVCVGYAHSTSSSHVEPGEFTVLTQDCDETDIVGEDVDVIRRRDGDGNFELKVCQHRRVDGMRIVYLPRQVKFPIQWLNVLDRISSNHLLIQPDLVIGGGLGDQMFADGLRELIHLRM